MSNQSMSRTRPEGSYKTSDLVLFYLPKSTFVDICRQQLVLIYLVLDNKLSTISVLSWGKLV